MNTKTKFGISIGIIIAVVISSQSDNHGLFSNSASNTINTVNNNNAESKTLRLGYFPNVNHAQAIIGLKNGDFQKIIEDNNTNQGKIKINEFVFSAGPSAIEALFGGQIDAAYVGPNPAISGYIASGGEGLRIVSGVASGGSVFIVRNDAGIESANDLGGKKFASPQLGNTQDISLRKYLISNGYNTVENGGDVTVAAVKPGDILTLMVKKEIDGAWVPEPWGARLVNEANGKILVDERDLWPPEGKFVTANIIVRTDYLQENPDVIEKLLEAHVNQTLWINNNKEKAINDFNVQLKKLTGKTIPQAVLANAVTTLEFTYDPIKLSLIKDANDAYDLGLLAKGKERPDLTNIYDLTILDKVLAQKGLDTISGVNIAPTINTGNNTSTNATSGDALSDIVT